jgi:Tfp pilus assembly protein PilF
MKEFKNALQLEPNHFRANLLLGRLYGMQGDGKSALPYLQKAVRLDPKSSDAHLFLSSTYDLLGQEQNARRERGEALRLKSGPGPTP